MRLFIAVYPSDNVLDELSDIVARLPPAESELRWTGREDWHLTLLFLGEVADEHVADLEKCFGAEAAQHAALELAVRGAGTFPGEASQARVLWAGIEGDVSPLTQLVTGMRKTARKNGIHVQRRPYVPHLTLARSRTPTDLTGPRTSLLQFASEFWRATEVQLVQSSPGQRPRYRTVASWALGC